MFVNFLFQFYVLFVIWFQFLRIGFENAVCKKNCVLLNTCLGWKIIIQFLTLVFSSQWTTNTLQKHVIALTNYYGFGITYILRHNFLCFLNVLGRNYASLHKPPRCRLVSRLFPVSTEYVEYIFSSLFFLSLIHANASTGAQSISLALEIPQVQVMSVGVQTIRQFSN